jgi:hypothetical protein
MFLQLRPLQNAYFCSSSRKANILTADIHCVFRGLKFEHDAEIGQKESFCKGLKGLKLGSYSPADTPPDPRPHGKTRFFSIVRQHEI